MVVITEQCFVEGVEVCRTIQFDSVEEMIAYCEYYDSKE